jgi:hypothetical protein
MNQELFITQVQTIIDPPVKDFGFALYSFFRAPETTFRKQMRNGWYSFLDYQYNQRMDILDYRQFFINIDRSREPHDPLGSIRQRGPHVLHGRLYRTGSQWVPSYLQHILAENQPTDGWLYRTEEELVQALEESIPLIIAILPLLDDLVTTNDDLAPLLYHTKK